MVVMWQRGRWTSRVTSVGIFICKQSLISNIYRKETKIHTWAQDMSRLEPSLWVGWCQVVVMWCERVRHTVRLYVSDNV